MYELEFYIAVKTCQDLATGLYHYDPLNHCLQRLDSTIQAVASLLDEAAMSAGLIAIGLDGGTAVSSVLLYRIATYWLPIPFGWFSLNRLQKMQAI